MPVALIIGSIAISAYGKIKAGRAAKKAGEFNAQALEAQAADAIARGEQTASAVRTKGRAVIGAQRVAFAGQNVRVDQGSPLDVQADVAYLAELDAQQARADASRAAWGFRTDAQSARMGGQAAASAAYIGAAADVTGGTGSLLLSGYGWPRSDRGSGNTRTGTS